MDGYLIQLTSPSLHIPSYLPKLNGRRAAAIPPSSQATPPHLPSYTNVYHRVHSAGANHSHITPSYVTLGQHHPKYRHGEGGVAQWAAPGIRHGQRVYLHALRLSSSKIRVTCHCLTSLRLQELSTVGGKVKYGKSASLTMMPTFCASRARSVYSCTHKTHHKKTQMWGR